MSDANVNAIQEFMQVPMQLFKDQLYSQKQAKAGMTAAISGAITSVQLGAIA